MAARANYQLAARANYQLAARISTLHLVKVAFHVNLKKSLFENIFKCRYSHVNHSQMMIYFNVYKKINASFPNFTKDAKQNKNVLKISKTHFILRGSLFSRYDHIKFALPSKH